MGRLEGKVAVITVGNSGIGHGTAVYNKDVTAKEAAALLSTD